jgi:hypothetical protein
VTDLLDAVPNDVRAGLVPHPEREPTASIETPSPRIAIIIKNFIFIEKTNPARP